MPAVEGDQAPGGVEHVGGLGVGPGDVVALQLPNWWEFVVTALACGRIGAVVNPLMPIFRERELEFMLGFAEAKVLVVPASFRNFDHEAMAERLKRELPKLEHVLVVDGTGAGAAAVALHARTAEQLYSGAADWTAVARLKEALPDVPVLGNGDVWEAADALAMQSRTGCDGVVVGRGCLGRPWLFRDLADAFAGRPVQPPPLLRDVVQVMQEHVRLLVAHRDSERYGTRDFRKHVGWYLTGYPVGGVKRRQLSEVASIAQVDDLLGELDPTTELPAAALRMPRGHTYGPKAVALPEGWLASGAETGVPEGADVWTSGG